MNSVIVAGTVASAPDHHYVRLTHTTEFDVDVATATRRPRTDRLHVVAREHLAGPAARLAVGTPVAVAGFLRSEAFDMPDRSIWHRVEIVAHSITRLGPSDQDTHPVTHIRLADAAIRVHEPRGEQIGTIIQADDADGTCVQTFRIEVRFDHTGTLEEARRVAHAASNAPGGMVSAIFDEDWDEVQ